MELTVLDNVRKRFLNALNAMVIFLKKNSSKKDNFKKSHTRSLFSPSVKNRNKLVRKKEVLGFKGSAYKGKGGVNKDAVMFNRLRKERLPGRYH